MNPNPDSPTRGSRRTRRLLAGLTLAAAVAAGGAGIAQAAANSSAPSDTVAATTEPSTTVAPSDDNGDDTKAPADDGTAPDYAAPADRPARPDNGETDVTGADADSASAAALAAVPGGTVKHVTTDTDDGGAFEVHMTDADGNRVKVILDANFAVIDTLTGGPGGQGGPGKPGGMRDNGETEVTDSNIALQASAAALDAVPGGTVKRVTTDTDDGGAYEVHMTDADGNRAKVILDENFAVIETKTGGPGGPGGRGGRDQATDDAAATSPANPDAALSPTTSDSLNA